MPYSPNQPIFNTKVSRISNFSDFNIDEEGVELDKLNRNAKTPSDEKNQTPGNHQLKYNKVTHKMDSLSKSEIMDKIDAIKGGKKSTHKYKLEDKDQQTKVEENNHFKNKDLQEETSVTYAKKWIQGMVDKDGNMNNLSEFSTPKMLRDFAKMHVRNAVREMIRSENDRISDSNVIEELTDEALDNFYPLDKIK